MELGLLEPAAFDRVADAAVAALAGEPAADPRRRRADVVADVAEGRRRLASWKVNDVVS